MITLAATTQSVSRLRVCSRDAKRRVGMNTAAPETPSAGLERCRDARLRVGTNTAAPDLPPEQLGPGLSGAAVLTLTLTRAEWSCGSNPDPG